MSKNEVRIIDHGANKLMATLERSRKKRLGVDVGVLDVVAYDDDITVAEVAEIHELGLNGVRRSWLRETISLHNREINAKAANLGKGVIQGKIDEKQALKLLGEYIVGLIKDRIQDGEITPPLEQSTIDKKGSDTPLLDTSFFLSSIVAKVRQA